MKRAAAGYKVVRSLHLLKNAPTRLWRLGIVLLLINCCSLPVFAQTKVSGVVNDLRGVGIEGVTVTEKGTTNATITDNTGHFTMNVVNAGSTLVFSHAAFQAQE